MSAISSVNGNNEGLAAQTASRAAAGAAEAASNKADGKENVNSYRNANIKNVESDSVQISTAAQTASDATAAVAEASSKEAAEAAKAAEAGKAIADVELKVVSKGEKAETSEKSAPLGSEAKADNTSKVAEKQKTATPAPRESIFAKKEKDNVKATPATQSEPKVSETNKPIKDSEKTTTTEAAVEKEAKEAYEANGAKQASPEAQFSALV
ncbi:MAG: hypothetical protein H8D23_40755 [Candidatus Brocadiales bacterium]|nr:hypothetical protein [Candidatus Brocadiales bacterium]